MKKLFAISFALILTLSLVACDSNKVLAEGNAGAIITGHYSEFDNASQAPVSDFAVSEGGDLFVTDDIIKKDRALAIALAHAGLTEQDIYDLDIDIEYEPNGTFWEIDFNSAGYEYEYVINAKTEEILHSLKQRD